MNPCKRSLLSFALFLLTSHLSAFAQGNTNPFPTIRPRGDTTIAGCFLPAFNIKARYRSERQDRNNKGRLTNELFGFKKIIVTVSPLPGEAVKVHVALKDDYGTIIGTGETTGGRLIFSSINAAGDVMVTLSRNCPNGYKTIQTEIVGTPTRLLHHPRD